MTDLLGVAAAYLLGSIPFGLLLSRLLSGVDPRSAGSRNIGATNVARTGGWGLGVLTLALDVGKGAAGVALGRWIADGASEPVVGALLLAAPAVGHIYPIWLRFRGGKGVATAVGVLALADPIILALAAGAFLVLVVPTRIVSLGSMGAALAAGAAVWALFGVSPEAIGVTVVAVLILWRHRENLRRLIRGEESRLGERRESPKAHDGEAGEAGEAGAGRERTRQT